LSAVSSIAIANTISVVAITVAVVAAGVVALTIAMVSVEPLGLMGRSECRLDLVVVIPLLIVNVILVGFESLVHADSLLSFLLWQLQLLAKVCLSPCNTVL